MGDSRQLITQRIIFNNFSLLSYPMKLYGHTPVQQQTTSTTFDPPLAAATSTSTAVSSGLRHVSTQIKMKLPGVRTDENKPNKSGPRYAPA
jgi:hypothetical protein